MICISCGKRALTGSLCALCANTLSASEFAHLDWNIQPVGSSSSAPGIQYATDQLQQACLSDQGISNKIDTIAQDGPNSGAGTPGPSNLHKNAQHRHVTNQTGVAY